MKTCSFFQFGFFKLLFIFCLYPKLLFGQYDVDITQQYYEVCPGAQYSYTAFSTAFGHATSGMFSWSVYENGVLTYSVDFPYTQSSSTISHRFGNNVGTAQVRVFFRLAVGGVNLASEIKTETLRIFSPGFAYSDQTNAGVVFCSGNQTRTVSIPGIHPFNTIASCFWHYKYRYIAPNNTWALIRRQGSTDFNKDVHDMESFSESASVRSPSSIGNGYAGNFRVIARYADLGGLSTETSSKIWIGPPVAVSPHIYITYQDECGDNITYRTNLSNPNFQNNGIQRFYWRVTYSYTSGQTSIQTVEGSEFQANLFIPSLAGTEVFAEAFGENICSAGNPIPFGTIGYTIRGVIGCGGGGCDEFICMNSYPNPSSDFVNVDIQEKKTKVNQTTIPKDKREYEIRLLDITGNIRFLDKTNNKTIQIDIRNFKKGIYYLHSSKRYYSKTNHCQSLTLKKTI